MKMTPNEYLEEILKSQDLADDGKEMRELRKHRQVVEALLCSKYGNAPHVRYGGSKAKRTMIRESYDLDLHCYFEHDDTVAGETLRDIYENVGTVLGSKYLVERKRSALRLTSMELSRRGVDLHIDVVPGRFIDGNDGDVFLYQNGAEKERLQTNLDVHIAHIRDSGVTEAIRLLKLWKVRNGLLLAKTFVLELLAANLLKGHEANGLSRQLEVVLTTFCNEVDNLSVEDPANPNGNDLSKILDDARFSLSSTAGQTLQTIESSGWASLFGPIDDESEDQKRQRLQSIAVGVSSANRTKPYLNDR
jgi:hypothetical protein